MSSTTTATGVLWGVEEEGLVGGGAGGVSERRKWGSWGRAGVDRSPGVKTEGAGVGVGCGGIASLGRRGGVGVGAQPTLRARGPASCQSTSRSWGSRGSGPAGVSLRLVETTRAYVEVSTRGALPRALRGGRSAG